MDMVTIVSLDTGEPRLTRISSYLSSEVTALSRDTSLPLSVVRECFGCGPWPPQ